MPDEAPHSTTPDLKGWQISLAAAASFLAGLVPPVIFIYECTRLERLGLQALGLNRPTITLRVVFGYLLNHPGISIAAFALFWFTFFIVLGCFLLILFLRKGARFGLPGASR